MRDLFSTARNPDQGIFGFLQRQKHRLLIGREVGSRGGIGGGDARAHATHVEEGTINAESDQACLAVTLEQSTGIQGLRTDQSTQREAREQVGRCHAHARGGCCQPALGGGHVGATTQQFGWRTRGDGLWQGWQRRVGIQPGQHGFRCLPYKHGDAMRRQGNRGLQGRHAGAGVFQLRSRAVHFKRTAYAGRAAQVDEPQGLRLVISIPLGDAQLFLQTAPAEVGFGQVADQHDLQCRQVGCAGLRVGTLRLHAAADAAEEIQFPQHTQPCAVLLHVPLSSPCTGQLVGTAA